MLSMLYDHPQLQVRKKRGLIDTGGWILKGLFGVGTESQIQGVKDIVTEGMKQQYELGHKVDKLSSVLNKAIAKQIRTVKYLNANRKVINQCIDNIQTLRHDLYAINEAVVQTRKELVIDNYLSALEQRHYLI